jgi:hypothetical protein
MCFLANFIGVTPLILGDGALLLCMLNASLPTVNLLLMNLRVAGVEVLY